jgi:L-threonylcarbamoyladenylate synthase
MAVVQAYNPSMELSDIPDIVGMFQSGQIGVFPTDTAFGIGCVIDNPASVSRIFEIRHRVETKPLLALVSSIEMAEQYVTIDSEVRTKLIEKFWPGGLTIVLPCDKDKVPSQVRANGETLAVRLPNHEKICSVVEKVGVPIVAPSANFAGEKTPYSLLEVDPLLIEQVDFVMKGECTAKEQSTIIDCTMSPWKVIREGAVKLEEF